MPLGPGSRLDAYELRQPLGAGGMGEVWLATEVRLGRKVALKLLPAELTRDPARVSRFEQEARAASGLSHPNVCTIHALGETSEGQHYIAMEYVEGETLRRRIGAGRLTIRESLDIAIQIASALVAAHANGIVHRDIKPENVIVRPDGFVKVLDFGLAKLTAPTDSAAVEATQTAFRTEAGTVVGTVAYMSPEQARGQQVDARTDIWSLGVVLYEMVAGRSPFAGSSSSDVLAAILDREPAPLARFASDVPGELQRIVGKTLRKERGQRYQSVNDMLLDLDDLRRELTDRARTSALGAAPNDAVAHGTTEPVERSGPLTAGTHAAVSARVTPLLWRAVLVLIVGVLGVLLFVNRDQVWSDRGTSRVADSRLTIRSLAVLPLENLSRDPEQEYFADGMTEALIVRLSSLRRVRVISRPSVMQFKGRHTPVPEVARILNVDAVVAGSVQRAGERVRISAQLVRGDVDETVWSDSFDRELGDLLALQSELARVISQQIGRTIADAPERGALNLVTPLSTEARGVAPTVYESYLKGLYELRRSTGTSVREAIDHFDHTVQMDAAFAPAHLGLAEAYSALGTLTLSVRPAAEVRQRALVAVRRALELDPYLARAHAVLASLQTDEWLWTEAEAGYRRALDLEPNLADAHAGLGWLLVCRRRFDEAIASSRRARELDPLSVSPWVMFGLTLRAAGRVEEALREFRAVITLHPEDWEIYPMLALALLDAGETAEAVRMNERAVELSNRGSFALGHLALAYARDGRRAEAEQLVQELRQLRKTQYVTPGAFVTAFAGLGDHDALLVSLEEAYAERANIMKWLLVEPTFDQVRSHPRFVRLVGLVGLD
jgi:eukaryotic-like serine/threonine-protein kinase